MAKSKFYEKIKSTTIERQIEDIYNAGIAFYFKDENGGSLKFEYPYACDGLIETKTDSGKLLKLLMEYKFNMDFTSKVQRAKVIVQVLFYMKRFENDGLRLPNVVLVGDKDECFVFHSNDIIKYLDYDIDWKTAPSLAADVNPELVFDIANDDNLNPFVFMIDENFTFSAVAQKIKDLANNVKRYVHVTEHNISTIYDLFINKVIKNRKKIKSHDLVGIFMGVITNGDEYYQHPTKKNILVTPMGNIDINGDNIRSFFDYFQRTYTPQEKNNLAAIADRLIEDTDRRNSGDFWTPTIWVDYAHKMISEQLGENWKDEYVVWDNSCGAKNLTRDYKFKELYCSTLFESELEIGKRYNPEATSFQFDFLNDEIEAGLFGESKVPAGLLDALKQNKKIVFFLNPPYGAPGKSSDNNKGVGGVTAGAVDTNISDIMKNNNIGRCSSNLYTQFLYRIMLIKQRYNLTNCIICVFSPKSFLTSSSYNVFRSHFLNNFSFLKGIQFQASHFADVSNAWAISFSIWNTGVTNNKTDFVYDTLNLVDGEISIIEKNSSVYNIDGKKPINSFIKDNKHNEYTYKLSIGPNMKISGPNKTQANSIGSYYSHGNDVMHNTSFVNLNNSGNKSIYNDNFDAVCTVIATRKLIDVNWKNNKNEHILPNNIPLNYINDCIIYSLFNNCSYIGSCRNINIDNKLWDIKNEFFWMSKLEIESLANEYNLDAIYNDARTSSERFVYEKLQTITLSAEAQAVLDKASELVRKSFKYRELFSEEHPEYQLDKVWDAGWYQVKTLLKEYMKDDLKEFTVLYKKLADKMRPMVYELGFLKK